jgi:hypothetical protein
MLLYTPEGPRSINEADVLSKDMFERTQTKLREADFFHRKMACERKKMLGTEPWSGVSAGQLAAS